MSIFKLMRKNVTSEVVFFDEPLVSLKAIIVKDNTVLGPALANCKIHNYQNEDDAIEDALNMAYYNTFRSALMHKSFGGGSIILWGDPKTVKTEMYFRALGIIINKFGGNIFLAKGSGLQQKDIIDIHRESQYILGLDVNHKGSGDTSENTAKGIIWGIKAAVKEKLDKTTLEGLSFVVQGIGAIGSHVVEDLLKEKVNITITDKIYDKIKVIQDRVPNITVVKPNDIYKTKCDVFISCAYDGVINDKNIDMLNCKILTGSVNRMLSSEKLLKTINEKDILYIPGFVINSGELIQLSNEQKGFVITKAADELIDIYNITQSVIREANAKKTTLEKVAFEKAKDYLDKVASIKMLK